MIIMMIIVMIIMMIIMYQPADLQDSPLCGPLPLRADHVLEWGWLEKLVIDVFCQTDDSISVIFQEFVSRTAVAYVLG